MIPSDSPFIFFIATQTFYNLAIPNVLDSKNSILPASDMLPVRIS